VLTMTRKDAIFLSVILIYLSAAVTNVFIYTFMKPEFMSAIIMAIMIPLVIAKTVSSKFSSWLEKPLRVKK